MTEVQEWRKHKSSLDVLRLSESSELNDFLACMYGESEKVLYSDVGFRCLVTSDLYVDPKTTITLKKSEDHIQDKVIIVTNVAVYTLPPAILLDDGNIHLVLNEAERVQLQVHEIPRHLFIFDFGSLLDSTLDCLA